MALIVGSPDAWKSRPSKVATHHQGGPQPNESKVSVASNDEDDDDVACNTSAASSYQNDVGFKKAADAASEACNGNNDIVGNDVDVTDEACEEALAQIAKMRICVESILDKLPDKSHLTAFKEISMEGAQQDVEPLTYVRLITT